MRRKRTRGPARRGLAAIAAGVLALQAGCAGGGWCSYGTVDETRTTSASFSAADSIEVSTRNGSVSIERDDTDRASIVARLRGRNMDRLSRMLVTVDTSKDGALIVGVEPPDGQWMNGEGASFDITVPGARGVSVVTSNGRIRVAGLGGDADLRTSNGSVDVGDQDGNVHVGTSNGRIELAGVTGEISAQTSNGRIEARDVEGRTSLTTSNGSVYVMLGDSFVGGISASTSNGRVNVDGALREGDRVSWATRNVASVGIGGSMPLSSVATSNGSITIRLPAARD